MSKDPALTTSLRLLFDGRHAAEIAEVLTEVLGGDGAETAFRLLYNAGVSVAMSLSPDDIEEEIEHRNEYSMEDTEEYYLDCTREELAALCVNYNWGDWRDLWSTRKDYLFDEALEKGLVKTRDFPPDEEDEQCDSTTSPSNDRTNPTPTCLPCTVTPSPRSSPS